MDAIQPSEFWRQIESSLIFQKKASSSLSSSTSLGRSRENLVSESIKASLPERIKIKRGEITDSTGNSSGECDLILLDSHRAATGIGGESIIPVEAALSAIEVKSSLSGKNLEDAIKKIARCKKLTRDLHRGNYKIDQNSDTKISIPPRQTLGVIIAFDAPSWTNIQQKLEANPSWYENDYINYGPDLLGVLSKGTAVKNDQHIFSVEPEFIHSKTVLNSQLMVTQLLVEYVQTLLDRYGSLTY